MSNYNEVAAIASRHLGKVGGEGYKDRYDPALLVKIPRILNRDQYGINGSKLPFIGYDIWNAYEVSALTENGLPVSGMLKIVYPANSVNHVESKSIKLYLNSFNMTILGKNTRETIETLERTVSNDLQELLETGVQVKMWTCSKSHPLRGYGYKDLIELTDLDKIVFDTYKSDASVLKGNSTVDGKSVRNKYTTNLLRSNCRVTNQPDWGDLYINIKSTIQPDVDSLAKYIVSHRKVSHFHEEIVEMTFMHLMEAFNPKELLVAALYTRRGGIDINPVRTTHYKLIPSQFYSTETRLAKTLRQ